jgi:very-short-patch-repair endonuclease
LISTEEFINRSNLIHDNKYDYSLVEFKGTNKKIKIICKKHGEFLQRSDSHLKGKGCKLCCNENNRINIDYFIKKANLIHDNKYDYSVVNFINTRTKIKIICPKHKEFEQTPGNHLQGRGCMECNKHKKLSTIKFIEKSNIIHNNKYDYSKVNYINSKTKIKIICEKHGEFLTTPRTHLSGSICKLCFFEKLTSNTNEFINQSNIIHNNKYNYSLVKYESAHKKIKIICPKHNIFEQTPNSHLKGNGCPRCNDSKGEKEIINILTNNNIKFEIGKNFSNCRHKRKLKFDFYLPNHNICIEFDGEQHFKNVDYYGGKKDFEIRKIRDDIKTTFCIENNIILLRIKYDENIKNKLKDICKY